MPDERARLRAHRRAARGRRHGRGRRRSTTPTSSCSTPAASGRTPTTSSTATSATSRPLKDAPPGLQIAVGGCLAQKDRDAIRADGAVRRRRLRHPQRRTAPPTCSTERRARRGRSSRSSRRPLPTTRAFPSALPARREQSHTRVGHHPDRLRQLAAPSASCRQCAARRSAGRSATSSPRSRRSPPTASPRSRCSARTSTPTAATSRWQPRAGAPARCARCSPTCSRAVGAVDGIRRVRFTSPHPKDLRPETIAAMADDAGGVRAPAPAAAVGQRPHRSPRMHRGYTAERYLERLAAGPRRDRPTSPSPPTSSSASRARPTTTSSARSRWSPRPSTTAPTRSSSRPGPAPRPPSMVDDFVARRRRRGALRAAAGRGRALGARPATRPGSAASRRSSSKGPSKQRPVGDDGPHPPEQARALRAAVAAPRRARTPTSRSPSAGAALPPRHARRGRSSRPGTAPASRWSRTEHSRAAPSALALVGPTASGKSALALAVARGCRRRRDRLGRLDAGVPGHGHRHRQADVRRAARDPASPHRRRRSVGGLHGRRVPPQR